MFDLLEEQFQTQEQQGDQNTDGKSARAPTSGAAALFSMPEKFIQKEDTGKKKSHSLVPILFIFIIILGIGSIALAFAIQSKNARLAAEENARQEAARAAALQAQRAANEAAAVSEEDVPFQFSEPETVTSTESVTSIATTSTQLELIPSATSTESSTSSLVATSTATESASSIAEEFAVTFGQDSDKDTLTDTEERVYNTDSKKPDTDSDGILDGAEVKNLFDPTKGESALLKDSGAVDVYTNQTYQYTFFYPKSDEWAVAVVDSSNREVLASAISGEYVSIHIQDNPQKLSIFDWYTNVYAAGKSQEKMQTTSLGQWNALMREDGLVYYLARKDEKGGILTQHVYVLTYAPNAKKELNYLTTFQMLVKSFTPLEIVVTIQK